MKGYHKNKGPALIRSNARLNSDFDVKCSTIQFYGKSQNSSSDRSIKLKF